MWGTSFTGANSLDLHARWEILSQDVRDVEVVWSPVHRDALGQLLLEQLQVINYPAMLESFGCFKHSDGCGLCLELCRLWSRDWHHSRKCGLVTFLNKYSSNVGACLRFHVHMYTVYTRGSLW